MLFRMTMENDTRALVATDTFTDPNLTLQTYGDGKNIIIAIGKNATTDPHLFDGLCDKPCGMTFRDKNNYFDLRGRANIRWTTMDSGFHRARPLIKLADGTLLVGDQAEGSTADWHPQLISFNETKWVKLDPVRGVTMGNWVQNPDLSKVDEAGFFDVIPGSGEHPEGVPVLKIPNPPVGGWIAMYGMELWGRPVPREARTE
jgi:hypothetical protein